jgi:hypothetical protein
MERWKDGKIPVVVVVGRWVRNTLHKWRVREKAR